MYSNIKILFLPNWSVYELDQDSPHLQAPDKTVKDQVYWFFRYFKSKPQIDILDIKRSNILHKIEIKLKFYIYQGFLAFFRQNKYDIIISHGAQSGVMLALLRRLFGNGKAKHIVFDIGGMNGAKSSGFSTSLIRFAMKSMPWIICHSTNIVSNIHFNYPFLKDRTYYIPFGIGLYQYEMHTNPEINKEIFVFAGTKRDVDIVIKAWKDIIDAHLDNDCLLKLVGTTTTYPIHSCISVKHLDYDQYHDTLEKSLFVIIPLKEFGYSYGQMSLLGSLALGKKVIASNVGGISDYLEKCPSVIKVRPDDYTSMKQAIIYCIKNIDKNFDRTIPRNEVAANFDEETMAQRIEDIVQSCLNKC